MAGIVKERKTKSDKEVVKQSKAKIPAKTPRGLKSLPEKIETVRQEVRGYLGSKAEELLLITKEEELADYVESCLQNGIVAIDTETNSLDVMTCKLVGFSLFTPNQKACYIPVNHIDYFTGDRIKDQLSIEEVTPYLRKLTQIKTLWFNSKFDIRVFRHTTGVYFTPFYDSYIASRLLNENEPEGGLKALHKRYVLKGSEDAFSFSELFNGISFDLIPIDIAYLYAARDAQITYELSKYQIPFLSENTKACKESDLVGVANVFWNIEMPIVTYICDMEDRGVRIDFDYQKVLSVEYNKKLEDAEKAYYDALGKYTDRVYSISSPKQLAELFYDDLKILKPVYDKKERKEKRTVDAGTLQSINHPLAKLILDYRENKKLISTYVDKVLTIEKNGRVHTNFNQVGTDTGRFSSSGDINLQNIPSHNKKIRRMFIPTDGYYFVGGDWSGAEVRIVSGMCKDEKMIQTYLDGKDLYCSMASLVFKVPYNECLEHFPKGTPIKKVNGKWFYSDKEDCDKLADGETDTYEAGKERRSIAKKVTLSILYGKGIRTLAEDLNKSIEETQEIYSSVMDVYPRLNQFIYDSKQTAWERGYVTTLFGRKRRLPDVQMPPYEFRYANGNKLTYTAQYNLTQKLKRMRFDERKQYIEDAKNGGVIIIDNGGYIARAERQCVNARVQGTCADCNKILIKAIFEDSELTRLGYRLLMTVHDEVIGECPKENAKIVKERLNYLMVHSLDGLLDVPMKCDTTVTDRWYGEELEV